MQVRGNVDVSTRLMVPEAAIGAGALALFGEKYGDEVRVVSMGDDNADARFSTELCGGTHVRRTGDIGLFKILSEGAVAAGVRRIEAVTGASAEAHVAERSRLLAEAGAALRAKPADVPARVGQMLVERRQLERDLSDLRRQMATGGGNGAAVPIKNVAGVAYTARRFDDVPAKDLRPMADAMKKKVGSGVIAIAAVAEGKVSLVVGVTADLVNRFDAVELVRIGVAELGGKGGGGRSDLAQGGGPDGTKADSALTAIEHALGG